MITAVTVRITDAVPITRKKRSWSILRPQCSTWGVCATMGRLATLAATRSSRLTIRALERLYVHGTRGPNFNPHKKLRYVPDSHQAKWSKRSIPEQPDAAGRRPTERTGGSGASLPFAKGCQASAATFPNGPISKIGAPARLFHVAFRSRPKCRRRVHRAVPPRHCPRATERTGRLRWRGRGAASWFEPPRGVAGRLAGRESGRRRVLLRPPGRVRLARGRPMSAYRIR